MSFFALLTAMWDAVNISLFSSHSKDVLACTYSVSYRSKLCLTGGKISIFLRTVVLLYPLIIYTYSMPITNLFQFPSSQKNRLDVADDINPTINQRSSNLDPLSLQVLPLFQFCNFLFFFSDIIFELTVHFRYQLIRTIQTKG